jgi:hypothetical protein
MIALGNPLMQYFEGRRSKLARCKDITTGDSKRSTLMLGVTIRKEAYSLMAATSMGTCLVNGTRTRSRAATYLYPVKSIEVRLDLEQRNEATRLLIFKILSQTPKKARTIFKSTTYPTYAELESKIKHDVVKNIPVHE